MALEFRTRDEHYKGHVVWPSGTTIWRAKVFVDHLPPGFLTKPYNPYLIKDRDFHRPRYVIDTHIAISKDLLLLTGIPSSGSMPADPEAMQLVMHTRIERDGLAIILVYQNCEYQGTLHPIPELPAEAYPPHLARYGHRPP
jgi:hypothetical protein